MTFALKNKFDRTKRPSRYMCRYIYISLRDLCILYTAALRCSDVLNCLKVNKEY